jgi:hypothetical protein
MEWMAGEMEGLQGNPTHRARKKERKKEGKRKKEKRKKDNTCIHFEVGNECQKPFLFHKLYNISSVYGTE